MKRKFTLLLPLLLLFAFPDAHASLPTNPGLKVMTQKKAMSPKSAQAFELSLTRTQHALLLSQSPAKPLSQNLSLATLYRLDYTIDYNWSEGQWIDDTKTTYTYDANKNVPEYITYDWNAETSEWINTDKVEYTYDSGNRITVETEYGWNSSTNQWEADSKVEYSYDANDNLTVYLSYDRNSGSGQLEPAYKSTWAYDESHNITGTTDSEWDSTTSQWVPVGKADYAYGENGSVTHTYYSWDELTSTYLLAAKAERLRDSRSNTTEFLYSVWGDESTGWIAYWKTEYTFDSNSNTTQEIWYSIDFMTFQLQQIEKLVYTYDLTVALNQLIIPPIATYGENYYRLGNKPLDFISYSWEAATSAWAENYKTIYYYSEQDGTVGVDDLADNQLLLYPNPVSKHLTINFESNASAASFNLFGAHGEKLVSKQVNSGEQLNLENLPSGLYLYQLSVDGKLQSGKLLKN